MLLIKPLLAGLALLTLAGCAAVQPSTPLGPRNAALGISLARSLPEQLPDKSAAFPHGQYVLIRSESAAGMLMPIPFVSEAITDAMDASAAQGYEARLAGVDPYRIMLAAMQDSPLLAKGQAGLTLQPFAFVQECVDERYRLSLVAHLQGADWTGRYVVHLPTTYSAAEFGKPTPEVLASLRRELGNGAQTLRQLIERGARDELKPSGARADLGSLYLVGGKAAGLLSPMLVLARNVDVIEEAPEHLIVRIAGDMKQPASVGGLFFGVHYLRKDQLHTFKKLATTHS